MCIKYISYTFVKEIRKQNRTLKIYIMNTAVKKISTNSKQIKDAVRKHILECVYHYDTEENFKTFEEAKTYLYEEFKRVANYPNNLKNLPNEQDRFQDFLGGCIFWFEFETYKIEEFLNGLGINPENKEFEADKIWRLYAYLIFRELKK